MTKLLTLQEAGALLRRTPQQMYWMRQVGQGPKSAKIGGRVMYREADIEEYIARAFEDAS